MKKFLSARVFKFVPVWALMLFVAAGTTYAAWVLLAKTSGEVLGVKAKHLQLSVDGSTWFTEHPAFYNLPELDADLGLQELPSDLYLKTSKDVTALILTIKDLVRTQYDGSSWDEVACPIHGVADIANHFQLFFDQDGDGTQEFIGEFDDMADVAIPFNFVDSDSDKVSDIYDFAVKFNGSAAQNSDCNNGAKISFAIQVEEAPAP